MMYGKLSRMPKGEIERPKQVREAEVMLINQVKGDKARTRGEDLHGKLTNQQTVGEEGRTPMDGRQPKTDETRQDETKRLP